MMHWNVTYNDPNRWNAVLAVSGPKWPWWDGILQSLKGNPLGSPKMDLVGLDGLQELQALRDELTHRTPVNFLRTTGGIVAFTKVRLEVYAIPIKRQELLHLKSDRSAEGADRSVLMLSFARHGNEVKLTMEGPSSASLRMEKWLNHSLAT
jgi:hypothetical protein